MKQIVFIGLDDTDVLGEKPGTGRVARELAQHLEGLGLGLSQGVSRHQLLVDPRIPYTSHNSSLCIAFETGHSVAELAPVCLEYVRTHSKQGADPGVCLGTAAQADGEVQAFGHRAEQEVLTKPQAASLADQKGLVLRELGGTGDGIIGALAAVGLRAEGNSGRLVELPGIRAVNGTVTAAYLLEQTAIVSVLTPSGVALTGGEQVISYDWIRPTLRGGRPILPVQSVTGLAGFWEPVENRKDKKKKVEEA